MEKDKLIFTDGTNLEYDTISVSQGRLCIAFNSGNFTELETKFSNAAVLEKIYQADPQGNKTAVHKNYSILKEITKRKNIVTDEINDVVEDVIVVCMEQEPEWVVSQRKQDNRISSVEETAEILTMDALA